MDSSSSNWGYRWWRKNESLSRTLLVLFLGQLVSFSTALMGFSSSLTATLGVDTPLTLSFFSYTALALVYGSILIYRRQKLMVASYWYLLLGFVDVQGNFLVNKAYQYSSLTSVTLLNCCTIAWVIILTWIFLRTRYSLSQFLGSAVCVAGLALVLVSDAVVGHDRDAGGTRQVLGDVLVIGGTLFFAMSNVGEEKDRVEVIAMIGLFGMLVSVCEIAVVERKYVESAKWSPEVILAFVGFALAGFAFYSIGPFVLKMSGSTLFNLSNLTSDMWAVLIRIFFYKQKVNWLYYVAFAIVGIGLIIYSISEKNMATSSSYVEEEEESRLLVDEENADLIRSNI